MTDKQTPFIAEFLVNNMTNKCCNKEIKVDTWYDVAEMFHGMYIDFGYTYTELCIPLYTVPMLYTCYYYVTLSPVSSQRDKADNNRHIRLYNENNELLAETITYNNIVAVNNIIEGFIAMAHQNFISRYSPCLVSNNRPYPNHQPTECLL